MHAIVVCDSFCLSRQRIIAQLEITQQHWPDFHFRLASEQEFKAIMATVQPLVLPLVAIGSDYFMGIPAGDDWVQWLSQIGV